MSKHHVGKPLLASTGSNGGGRLEFIFVRGGPRAYVWIGLNGQCVGTLEGRQLTAFLKRVAEAREGS